MSQPKSVRIILTRGWTWIAIYSAIAIFWIGLEYLFYGNPKPSNEDSIITCILATSLNQHFWNYVGEENV